MKQGIHPIYGPVVFRDPASGTSFLTRSTIVARLPEDHPRVEWRDGDGEPRSYPVVDVDVSSTSHPFWTGRGRVLDTEGRVAKFRRRYGIDREVNGATHESADE